MDFLQKLKNGFVFLDGGMGTMLHKRGLKPGESTESMNITAPDVVRGIHREYLDAGCDIICANTFSANPLKSDNWKEMLLAGVDIARNAVEDKKNDNPDSDNLVALDIGPCGRLLEPYGDLPFEAAVEAFGKVICATKDKVDLITLETFTDLYELKAAVIAAKENSSLPIVASVAFGENNKLMTGADAAATVATLEGLGVDALGTNCSLGPKQLMNIVPDIIKAASIPVMVCPNAGLPEVVNGETVFPVEAEEFAEDMAQFASMGAVILGGCCGTTPDHIRALISGLDGVKVNCFTKKSLTVVSSYTHAVSFGEIPLLIGERINPTGKKKFKQALRDGDMDYILNEGYAQVEKGVHILDVNVGLPEIDEPAVMENAVKMLQASIDTPLQIDSSDGEALERAMRIYNGKPLVNSVNGKEESMETVFPLIKKYGGVVVALTLDENGIPETAHGRYLIAEKIINRAAEYGIDKKDIIVDALTMAVSAQPESAQVTVDAIREIKEKLGVATCLGVSNISFGLPERGFINSTFFALALSAGLDSAIMNPYSEGMMAVWYSYLALMGKDANFASYIEFASSASSEPPERSGTSGGLAEAIIRGMADRAAAEASALLETDPPLDIIDKFIIPALSEVGKAFENGRVFLPQLLSGAEAARSAFGVIRNAMPAGEMDTDKKIVLATVKGDIHDIGKNILKVLLENYGFCVIDLGRDVPSEEIVNAVISSGARLVGLSALMTTTVPSMEEATRLIHEKCPGVAVCVGGAVLNEEYAKMIGADYYSPDAMSNVHFAEKYFQ